MTNKEAIIVLKNIAWFGKIYDQEQTEEAVCMAINALQAQESCNQLATNLQPSKQDADDLISRAAAIDAVEFGITYAKAINVNTGEGRQLFKEGNDALKKAVERIKDLPFAQPETHEKHTETHSCDCISRQAAIDAAIDAVDDWEGCTNIGRQKRIENYINKLPSAQPDLSGYSDKLWKAAYERGRAEAQQMWIPCSERLPFAEYGESDNVLATCGYRDVEDTSIRWIKTLYFNGGCWCYPTGEVYDQKVYAWMPLPEPYREEGD